MNKHHGDKTSCQVVGFAVLACLVLSSSLVFSCTSTDRTSSNTPQGTSAKDKLPTTQAILASYNQRIDRIGSFYARGVMEIRWTDESGAHFEQGNVDLWVYLPNQISLRVEKFGEVFLWVGQNESESWAFDMTGDQTSLTTQPRITEVSGGHPELTLATLLGLGLLTPKADDLPEPVALDKDGLWQVSVPDGSGTQTWKFDPKTSLPRGMTLHDAGGSLLAELTFDPKAFEAIKTPGVSSLSAPSVPGRIRLSVPHTTTTSGEHDKAAQITLRIVKPDGDTTDQPMDRVFDLQRLSGALKPQHTQQMKSGSWLGGGLLTAQPAPGAPTSEGSSSQHDRTQGQQP